MFRLNVRQLCGKCFQVRTFTVARPLCAENEHIERSNKQHQSAGASNANDPKQLSKQTVDDVLRQSSKIVGKVQGERTSVAGRLFMNEVDEELLAFPEVADKSTLDKINATNASKSSFFNQPLSIVNGDNTVFDELKNFDTFKYSIQSEYGGLGYSMSETILASEPEGQNVSVALALSAHRKVCSAIGAFGTVRQKEKYLPLLASGDLIGTACIYEERSNKEKSMFESTAEFDEDTDEYIINGTKAFVVNSINAKLFLVFAQTRTPDELGDIGDTVTAFLVDANTPGVTIGKKDETIGCDSVYQSTVSFKNVRVKSDSCLSNPGQAKPIIQNYIAQKRLQHGMINICQMKKLIAFLSQYCDEVEKHTILKASGNIGSLDAVNIRDAIAHLGTAIYSSESILYMTSGITDLFADAEIDMEAAIVKVYTQERLHEMMERTCSFMGPDVTIKGHPLEEQIRNIVQLQMYDDPKESLRLYVGMMGIQCYGRRMFEDIMKKRNPLFHPGYIMAAVLGRQNTIDQPKLTLKIKKHLHPTLDLSIQWFEESLARVQLGAQILMTDYAKDLLQQHVKVGRLADGAILNYVSMASLARSSRALCLKFKSASTEHCLAGLICEESRARILHLMKEIEGGKYTSFDGYYQKVSKMLTKEKQYFPEHPLSRYF